MRGNAVFLTNDLKHILLYIKSILPHINLLCFSPAIPFGCQFIPVWSGSLCHTFISSGLFSPSAGHKAQHYDSLHGRTLPRQVWPHGLLWDLRAGSERRVSLPFHFYTPKRSTRQIIKNTEVTFNVLIVSLFLATSQLLLTTEVGCPATEPSFYIRSDHVTPVIYKTWDQFLPWFSCFCAISWTLGERTRFNSDDKVSKHEEIQIIKQIQQTQSALLSEPDMFLSSPLRLQ